MHSTQEIGGKDIQTARVRRSAMADMHPINASPSDPVRSSGWLTCCRAGRFSIRQDWDGAPADAQRSASAAHGWEAKQNAQQYHPPAGFHPSRVLMWAWNVPRKRHFHWVTSWIPSPLTRGPTHPPYHSPLCGAERLPPGSPPTAIKQRCCKWKDKGAARCGGASLGEHILMSF